MRHSLKICYLVLSGLYKLWKGQIYSKNLSLFPEYNRVLNCSKEYYEESPSTITEVLETSFLQIVTFLSKVKAKLKYEMAFLLKVLKRLLLLQYYRKGHRYKSSSNQVENIIVSSSLKETFKYK